MTSDTATRFRIELHGENSGLLDTISGDSMEGVRSLLIHKLETGIWTFDDGDTLKVVAGNKGYAYFIVETHGDDSTPEFVAKADTLKAYSDSYTAWTGNWTSIWKRRGVWQRMPDDRKPKMWKTAAGAEAKLEQLSKYDPKKQRAIVRLRWND